MANLPHFLYGTYKQYKVYTDMIIAYLVETAYLCGYRSSQSQLPAETPLSSVQAPKLKGRARKLARDAAQEKLKTEEIGMETFAVSVRDFLPMAQAIANFQKPPVEVPQSFVTVAKRVLRARRRCATWFQQQSHDEATDLRNQSHLHFINILQQVVDVLTPRFASTRLSQQGSEFQASLRDVNAPRDTETNALNRFEGLSIEDPVSDEEADMPLFSSSLPTTETTRKIVFVSEKVSDDEELRFACFCLLDDLNKIRSYLQDLWKRFLRREVALVTASLITNEAFDIARRMEQDFFKQFPNQCGYKETYVKFFYDGICKARGQAGVVMQNGDISCNSIFNPLMAEVLDWTFIHSWDITTQTWCRYRAATMDEGEEKTAALAALRPVSIEGNTELEATLRSWERYMEHYQSMFTMFSQLFGVYKETIDDPYRLIDRYFRALVRCSYDKSEITMWLAFAVQVHFDLYDILQDAGLNEVVAQVLAEYQTTIDRYDSYLKFLKSPENPDGRNDYFMEMAERVLGIIEREKKALEVMKSKQVRKMLGRHPVQCGLVVFQLHMQSKSIGQVEAGVWGSVVTAAHAYNAAQQEGILSVEWPDLELVIGLHGAQHLFVGGRPSSTDNYYSRWRIAKGYSILDENQPSGHGPRRFTGHRTPFCQLLGKLIDAEDEARDDQAEDLELMVAMVTKDEAARKKIKLLDGITLNRAEMRKACAKLPKASPPELLQQLEKHVNTEMAELHFDYLGLTIRCTTLEDEFRQIFETFCSRDDAPEPLFRSMTPFVALKMLQQPYRSGGSRDESGLPSYRRSSADQDDKPKLSDNNKSSDGNSQPFVPGSAFSPLTSGEKAAMKRLLRGSRVH